MEAPINFRVGTHVFVEDPEVAWIDGEIAETNGEEIKVKCTSDKAVVVKASSVHPKDPEFPPSGVDDMTRLAYLHEPGVLKNLQCRYDINEIYTYTGNILIAVNPFQRLPHLYGHEVMEKYKGSAIGELSPHPFAIADSAYRWKLYSCLEFPPVDASPSSASSIGSVTLVGLELDPRTNCSSITPENVMNTTYNRRRKAAYLGWVFLLGAIELTIQKL